VSAAITCPFSESKELSTAKTAGNGTIPSGAYAGVTAEKAIPACSGEEEWWCVFAQSELILSKLILRLNRTLLVALMRCSYVWRLLAGSV